MMASEIAIVTNQLTQRFDSFTAVNNVNFEVPRGSIFGFLGPNGAGKTTTILMLITLLKPSSGSAEVGGYDILRSPDRVRSVIGYTSQDIAVDEYLTGRENLLVQGHLYHLGGAELRHRIQEALEMVGLADRADEQVAHYSGGMRKRLDIAGALLNRPQILFLDEPTLGLDLQTRAGIWEYIRKLREEYGITIFLTTHYMEEADLLCDTVAIIDHGQIKVIDSPKNLKASLGGDLIEVTPKAIPEGLEAKYTERIKSIPGVKQTRQENGKLFITASSAESTIPQVFNVSNEQGIRIEGISAKQPSLDDVFLTYTGRALRDEEATPWMGRRTLERFRRARA